MSEFDMQNESADIQARAAIAGERPAMIEEFGIRGLYGYRTISLSSQYAATILIAKNGTGKTTLLGALDAFLKLQFYRLRELDFSEIYCRIKGVDEELVLTHDDLVSFLQPEADSEVYRLASKTGVDVQSLLKFLLGDYKSAIAEWPNDYDQSSIVNTIYRPFSHNTRQVYKACDDAYASFFSKSASLEYLRATLTDALADYEIVYLPTYRRVELALTDEPDTRRSKARAKPKLNLTSTGLHTAEIQFGLGDISDRLSQLNSEVISRSNGEYREISENIINELIRGYEVSPDAPIPNSDDLKLFFSRLESGRRVMGPQYSRISAPDLAKVYSSEGVPPESAKFLKYFLNKLHGIIKITKDIEKPVGDFVNSCNRYLSSYEPSTVPPHQSKQARLPAVDSKALKVNPADLSVHVVSLPKREPIRLRKKGWQSRPLASLSPFSSPRRQSFWEVTFQNPVVFDRPRAL